MARRTFHMHVQMMDHVMSIQVVGDERGKNGLKLRPRYVAHKNDDRWAWDDLDDQGLGHANRSDAIAWLLREVFNR